MNDKSRPMDQNVKGGGIPASTPGNQEPAEGSRETVTNRGEQGGLSHPADPATEKSIARHAKKARSRMDASQNRT